jgi:hypothetical protein
MMTKLALLLLMLPLLAGSVFAQKQLEIIFEDYNDQDIFNNFSGDWNKWEDSGGIATFSWAFDTANCRGDDGACLRVDYSVPSGGYGGLWNSLIGKGDYHNQYLNFTDTYGDLRNSGGNPTIVENVQITHFNFWAKGNGSGDYDHIVKVELKDTDDHTTYKTFTIPNASDWTKYEFPVSEMENVDFTRMKQVVFVLSDYQNDYRTSHFYLDDLSFSTDETSYDASAWTDSQFLDLVAHRAFKYFLTFTDTLGFALDRSTFSDLVSVGAIGFQLAAYCIGHKRGWADGLESRVEKILGNLAGLPKGPEPGTVNAGYNGFFYHFLDANTGRRKDDTIELSLYDTMLLMYGILTCKEYFGDNHDIGNLAQALYDSVQWNWMVDTASGDHQHQFHLAWKPETGFEGHVDGYTDEALLVDVLALGSTTYPTTMETYNARERYMGVYLPSGSDSIAASWTGSLFTYFFASCWLNLEDRGDDQHASHPLNIWKNNKRAIIANHQFCMDHHDDVMWDGDNHYTTYGDSSWGLTACAGLSQYCAFGALPTEEVIRGFANEAPHLGTIAVYGAGSSITYVPDSAIAALRHYYSHTGLWSTLFGFGDAYSIDPHTYEADPVTFQPILDENGDLNIYPATWLNGPWVNHMTMAIDEGPMLLAIENYRGGMIWDSTNGHANIGAGLDSVFGPVTRVEHDNPSQIPVVFALHQNYPNPFNASTIIRYDLPKKSEVILNIYNVLGQQIRGVVNASQSAGSKSIVWDGKNDKGKDVASGIYFYQLTAGDYKETKKMTLTK